VAPVENIEGGRGSVVMAPPVALSGADREATYAPRLAICAWCSHSARRSRLMKISCHAASRPIGLPQIRIEVGPRCWGGQVT
jgi:hypothetical protein